MNTTTLDPVPLPTLQGVHHIALITSDYDRSKYFYTKLLGFKVLAENYWEARNSFKLDLLVPGGDVQLELFSFPDRPERPSFPEAKGW